MTTSADQARPRRVTTSFTTAPKNKSWLYNVRIATAPIEQFNDAAIDGEINGVPECVPAADRYFVRQRRLRWVCFVQEVDPGVDEDAAIDTFEDEFDPRHSFIESAVPYIADCPAAVFDRRSYLTRETSPTPTDAGAALPE